MVGLAFSNRGKSARVTFVEVKNTEFPFLRRTSRHSATTTVEPYLTSYRWIILAIVWMLYAAFGLVMRSISPVVSPMLQDLNMSYSEMGVILGSWQLVYIPFSVLAGVAMDRWGLRKTLFVGALIVALSEGIRYFATGFGSLLPMVAVFGIGGPLISVGAPKAIAVWFRGMTVLQPLVCIPRRPGSAACSP